MLRTRIYFDNRRPDKAGCGQLRLILMRNNQTAMISLGISLQKNQWANGVVVNHADAQFLNNVISSKKGAIDRSILEHTTLGTFVGMSMNEIVSLLRPVIDPDASVKQKEKRQNEKPLLLEYFITHAEEKDNAGTRTLYLDTYKKLESFCSLSEQNPKFDDINKSWLESFEKFCLRTERQNSASRHLRDLRAVFNSAIDNGITTNYPFRKFKIKKEITIDKSYTSEELRALFTHPCYPGGEQEAVDLFKLMFVLIGINCGDLYYAGKVERGRLNYVRRKTHKPYSIRIEPEAEAIISKYAGELNLINLRDRCPNYKTYFNRMVKTLRKIGKQRVEGKKSVGEAILPYICTGSARTSWATIAQEELDIPREVIAAALGHHTVDVTSTYLRTEWKKKVDAANRKVLDWVFYRKKD